MQPSTSNESFLISELLKNRKGIDDLLKWKFIAVAAMESAGLAIPGPESWDGFNLVPCAVPFVCIYIDLLCKRLMLRNKRLMHDFSLSKNTEPNKADVNLNYFEDENKSAITVALRYFTAFVAILNILIGLMIDRVVPTEYFWYSGLIALVMSLLIENRYNRDVKILEKNIPR